jgi:hypothetical protein
MSRSSRLTPGRSAMNRTAVPLSRTSNAGDHVPSNPGIRPPARNGSKRIRSRIIRTGSQSPMLG